MKVDYKISVVIPCYNMGDFVKDALASVFKYPKQKDLEIIVVNDGSDDEGYTKRILDSYTAKNLTVVHQKNAGLGAARNKGIELATAPYIIPLDADNKLRPVYIERGTALLDENPEVGMVYGDNRQFGMSEQDIKVGEFNVARLIKKNYIDACVVLRKRAWESVKGYDEKMPVMGYEDWDLNMRLFFKGWRFKYIPLVCYDYRVRENSMLVNSNRNRELLISYIFSKPDLIQAKILRDKIFLSQDYENELKSIKNRKFMRVAFNIEKILKTVFKQ
ncbi:glycosyltransferase family 2 protein [Hanstruepera marina]|uniref:glycosyltransferase family 2 protein n=1 Tax=Hanstruepera marina TaxID=2873265 RepID=UPI001CA7083A|nr:glycosyltransferase family A protein [Hanstruepera marina]